jgi:hypothetical protein
MSSEMRCKALTVRGERCRNMRRYGDYCYTHKSSAGTSLATTVGLIAQLVSATTGFVTIIEKAHHHLPTLLHWISLIDLSTKCADCTPLEMAELREFLKKEGTFPFGGYAHILKREMEETNSHRNPGLEKIPTDLRLEMLRICDEVIDVVSEVYKQRQCHIKKIATSGKSLLELIEKVGPAATNQLVSAMMETSKGQQAEWWQIETLKHDPLVWRMAAIAEYYEAKLSTRRDAVQKDEMVVEDDELKGIPNWLQKDILKEAEQIIFHAERLEELGGEYS